MSFHFRLFEVSKREMKWEGNSLFISELMNFDSIRLGQKCVVLHISCPSSTCYFKLASCALFRVGSVIFACQSS